MGATTSKDDAPFETLDADQVRDVVAGFGTQFAGAADKMREAGIDGDYLAHASDDDLAVVFEECGLTNKLQQSLLKQKLRKATRAPVVPPPLPPRPISPKDDAPTPPASPKANAPAPLRVRVTCPADGYAGKPIVVQIPDGRKARAAIPEGCAPGETFTILVPAAPPVHRVSVTCPPDKPPGSQLLVRVPSSGQTIRATVPRRLGPGRSFTIVAPAAPVAGLATQAVPNVSLSSASIDTSAAASGTAGIAKKFAKEVAKEYAWDQAKEGGKEVLASIVSSDAMADASGLLLGV